MSKWQIILLVLLSVILLVVTIATWGSVGSVLCTFLLILMGVTLAYRKFVLDRDEDKFDWEL